MTDWIKGGELLDHPYNLNRRDILKAVQDGILVPYESPDAEYIKRHGILDADSERIWRVFPTIELQQKWVYQLCHKKHLIEMAQKWSSKSDEERIAAHKHDLGLDWGGAPPHYLVDLETFINRVLPERRRKESKNLQELPAHIKRLEEELAPNRVWKELDLGPAQQEVLMDKLLDASYQLDQVEAISGARSQKQIISEGKTQRVTVPPGTHWKNIKITLISDDTVRIKTPDWDERFHFSELGLSDKRKVNAPTLLWELLKLFAQNNGFISRNNQNYDDKLPKSANRLNKHLNEFFGINESIYYGHYKKEGGYKTKIIFSKNADLDLSNYFDQTSKKLTISDVKGLPQDQITRTPANAGKVIEGKDKIRGEIVDIFTDAQKKG